VRYGKLWGGVANLRESKVLMAYFEAKPNADYSSYCRENNR